VRKVLLTVLWITAGSATALLGVLAYELSRTPPPAQPMTIERLPQRQSHHRWARWTVTEHLSAHRVLIAHVETDYLNEARSIAQQIADPIKTRYTEVLIYFHRPGRPDTLPPRKISWTPTTGYVETVYD
jgi:hypothetical protein